MPRLFPTRLTPQLSRGTALDGRAIPVGSGFRNISPLDDISRGGPSTFQQRSRPPLALTLGPPNPLATDCMPIGGHVPVTFGRLPSVSFAEAATAPTGSERTAVKSQIWVKTTISQQDGGPKTCDGCNHRSFEHACLHVPRRLLFGSCDVRKVFARLSVTSLGRREALYG